MPHHASSLNPSLIAAPADLTGPTIHWPFNEPLVEFWKSRADGDELCRSALSACGRWSKRSDDERFVVTTLVGLSSVDRLDIHALSCLCRQIVVTPFAGCYEHPTGYHVSMNGSPPRGQAVVTINAGAPWEARYCPWSTGLWKALPLAKAERLLTYAKSVSPRFIAR